MRILGLIVAFVCVGLAIVAINFQGSASPSRELVAVIHHRQAVSKSESVVLEVAFIDPTEVNDHAADQSSLKLSPQYAPGNPVSLQIRITNATNEELTLLEPFFVSEDPPAVIVLYPGTAADQQTSAQNRPQSLEDRFTRWPFLTEFGRRESTHRSRRPQRTLISPGASIVREVCFSNLYDVSPSWCYYQIYNPAIQLERPTGEAISLGGAFGFQVTGPDKHAAKSVDALIVRE